MRRWIKATRDDGDTLWVPIHFPDEGTPRIELPIEEVSPPGDAILWPKELNEAADDES